MKSLRKELAEALGTFMLVFTGTGAVIIDGVSGGVVTHLGVALTFGLVVLAMIYTLGDISGAHLNPAVTLAFWVAKRFPGAQVWRYLMAQAVGALLASGLLKLMFPGDANLGATHPAGAVGQTFILEVVLTLILMFVILNVSTGAKEKGITAGIAIGAVIMLEAAFAGPISGASMNPIRSLAPAVMSGHFGDLWIYLLAPVLGATLAVPLYCGVRENCCSQPDEN